MLIKSNAYVEKGVTSAFLDILEFNAKLFVLCVLIN